MNDNSEKPQRFTTPAKKYAVCLREYDRSKFEQLYEETCVCGNLHRIVSKKDNQPEYYAQFFVICECGKRVPFEIPVN